MSKRNNANHQSEHGITARSEVPPAPLMRQPPAQSGLDAAANSALSGLLSNPSHRIKLAANGVVAADQKAALCRLAYEFGCAMLEARKEWV
jgi:hypothetical protein